MKILTMKFDHYIRKILFVLFRALIYLQLIKSMWDRFYIFFFGAGTWRDTYIYIHTYIHTYIQLYSNSLKSFSKGLVIICRLRAGTKDFWGDHTVFKGTEEGISPS